MVFIKKVELKLSSDNGSMGKRWSLRLGVILEVKTGYRREPNLRLKLGDRHRQWGGFVWANLTLGYTIHDVIIKVKVKTGPNLLPSTYAAYGIYHH
jgi:hypothetical protein